MLASKTLRWPFKQYRSSYLVRSRSDNRWGYPRIRIRSKKFIKVESGLGSGSGKVKPIRPDPDPHPYLEQLFRQSFRTTTGYNFCWGYYGLVRLGDGFNFLRFVCRPINLIHVASAEMLQWIGLRNSPSVARTWTNNYKEFLETLVTGSEKAPALIQDYKDYNTDKTVRFIVQVTDPCLLAWCTFFIPLLN